MTHSKTAARSGKARPQKPRKDFPLFPHAAGYWAKKVRGKLVYFGKVASDPKGESALALWVDQKDDLLAGRTPRIHRDGLTVRDLCNAFLTSKKQLVSNGELSPRTWSDYHATCERIIAAMGKTRLVDDLASDDFDKLRASVAKRWGHVALSNEINRVRVVFKYAYDASLIERPMRYGPTFKRPSAKTLRQARHAKGARMFEARHIRRMLKAAGPQLRAMILLGINCGLGNNDCGTLPLSALDLKGGWLDFPRPKTGMPRRCPLWPQTLEAVKAAIAERPEPKNAIHRGLVFITKQGGTWAKDTSDNPISKEVTKLLKPLGLHRPGLGYYALRHTFETIGGEAKDQVAVNAIMGHAPHGNDMSAVYRERISDDRLQAVTAHVRRWLFRGRDSKPQTRNRTFPR